MSHLWEPVSGFKNPSGKNADGTGDCLEDDCPVGNVNLFEIVSYANALSAAHDPPLEPCYVLSGCAGEIGEKLECDGFEAAAPSVYECEGYRLPTEAEWEYAARGGTRTSFYSGEITRQENTHDCFCDPALEEIAWYCNNSGGQTHPVRQLEPNGWGLYDMIGNATERVNSHGPVPRPSGSQEDPGGTSNEKLTGRNSGCLYFSWSSTCVVSFALTASSALGGPGGGFRLVRTLDK